MWVEDDDGTRHWVPDRHGGCLGGAVMVVAGAFVGLPLTVFGLAAVVVGSQPTWVPTFALVLGVPCLWLSKWIFERNERRDGEYRHEAEANLPARRRRAEADRAEVEWWEKRERELDRQDWENDRTWSERYDDM